MTQEPWRRTVECKDAFDREGQVSVAITDAGDIAISTPPHGYGVITYGGGDLLKSAIAEAQGKAAQLRRPRSSS